MHALVSSQILILFSYKDNAEDKIKYSYMYNSHSIHDKEQRNIKNELDLKQYKISHNFHTLEIHV